MPQVIKVLAKTMDTSLSPDKVELSTLTRDVTTGKVGAMHGRGNARQVLLDLQPDVGDR
jgi:hypothetical protein